MTAKCCSRSSKEGRLLFFGNSPIRSRTGAYHRVIANIRCRSFNSLNIAVQNVTSHTSRADGADTSSTDTNRHTNRPSIPPVVMLRQLHDSQYSGAANSGSSGMDLNRAKSAPTMAKLQGILGDLYSRFGHCADTNSRPPSPTHQAMRIHLSLAQSASSTESGHHAVRLKACGIAVGIALLASGQVTQAAIPLLGPCDPDFRSSAGCSPGPAKEERPAAPAASAKTPKSAPPATSAPAPLKSAPAAKSPHDARPEHTTQVSQASEENCPKTHRADSADEYSPLITVSLTVGP